MFDSNPKKMYVRDYRELLLDSCALFDSREQYEALRGVEPPPFDSTRRTKRWMLVEPELFVAAGCFNAMILAQDGDTGEVLQDRNGKPFLIDYSFSVKAAMEVNIPMGTANEVVFNGAAARLPLRNLAFGEHLEFREGLGSDAGLISVFSSYIAYLVDDQCKPVKPINLGDVWNKLAETQEQLSELKLQVELCRSKMEALIQALGGLEK